MQNNTNVIHTLSSETINQIAAGEVVRRPSSVVKELMENSIDAGADKIDVIIQDAGRTLIQVIDNGKGMSAADSVKAFERHATSKIKDASDLYALSTMGFRGEALASIAAVSRVELKTRREDDELGSMVEINGGEVASQEFISCPKGTQILVKDLFYNIPVRRKFLKKNETELRNILSVFQQVALVYPEICFTLSHNGNMLFNLAKENLRQRISSVCDAKSSRDLLSFDVDTTMAHISGFISTPEVAVKKQPSQFFFVNGRYIQHSYFAKAVQLGYEKILPSESKPHFFIYFDVAPDKIDVNIHPTKTEVRFEDEQSLFSIISAAVRNALASSNAMPTLMFDQEDRINIPVMPSTDFSTITPPPVTHNIDYNPFSATKGASGHDSYYKPERQSTEGWENLYKDIKLPSGSEAESAELFDADSAPKAQFRGFIHGDKYIVCSTESGIMVVNSYRASVRVVYDRLSASLRSGKCAGQSLMFPEILELTPTENLRFGEIRETLESVGYSFEPFGPTAYQVTGVPAVVTDADAMEILKDLASQADSDDKSITDIIREKMLLLLSSKSARRGGALTADAAARLIENLHATSMPAYTPEGLQIFYTIETDDVKKHIG